MVVESIHGALRTLFLEPWLGSFRARQIGVFTGCILIGTLTLIFIRWIGLNSTASLFALGAAWVALTLIFEFVVVGPALGYSWERATEDYDLTRGGLMIFGLLFMFVMPYVAWHTRSKELVVDAR